MTQVYTSADTSINSTKVPAIFKKVDWKPHTINVDLGGGKFDTATDYLKDSKVLNLIYDPYNRSELHNTQVMEHISYVVVNTVTLSNVLNVIMEKECRIELLRLAKNIVNKRGKVYISVYEGNKTGRETITTKGYQLNRKLKDYEREILEVFDHCEIKRGFITAWNDLDKIK